MYYNYFIFFSGARTQLKQQRWTCTEHNMVIINNGFRFRELQRVNGGERDNGLGTTHARTRVML